MIAEKIILAGGSGFVGSILASEFRLAAGNDVVILTRHPHKRSDGAREVLWDAQSLGGWGSELEGAKAVVNLTGKSVKCRYTPENRREIVKSRVDSVRVIDAAIASCVVKPKVLIQAATAAIYGDAGEQICDEFSPVAEGFSPEVAKAWEAAFQEAVTPETRRIILRIGFVLGRQGGALELLGKLTRWGLGGSVGSGKQWMSWIHEADFARTVRWVIEDERLSGMFLCVGPEPVRNADFMRELRRALHRPWSPPAPAWAVRVGCVVMRTEAELALKGRRCFPRRLIEGGFHFDYADLRNALSDIFGKR